MTNRLGDVLAYTSGFDQLARPTGLLDAPSPNLTHFVFTDRRARNVFPDWEAIAEERAFDLRLAPPGERSEQLMADLEAVAGRELTRRLDRHQLPDRGTQRWHHPVAGELGSSARCSSSRLPTPSSSSCSSQPTTPPPTRSPGCARRPPRRSAS